MVLEAVAQGGFLLKGFDGEGLDLEEESVAGKFDFGVGGRTAELDGVGKICHLGVDACGVKEVLVGDLEFPGYTPTSVTKRIRWMEEGTYS